MMIISRLSTSFATKTILGTLVFNSTDVTNEISNSINSALNNVLIKNVGQPWTVRPITIWNSDIRTIIFEAVALQAKSGAFTLANGTPFKLKDCSNFKIYGYGATFHVLSPNI